MDFKMINKNWIRVFKKKCICSYLEQLSSLFFAWWFYLFYVIMFIVENLSVQNDPKVINCELVYHSSRKIGNIQLQTIKLWPSWERLSQSAHLIMISNNNNNNKNRLLFSAFFLIISKQDIFHVHIFFLFITNRNTSRLHNINIKLGTV